MLVHGDSSGEVEHQCWCMETHQGRWSYCCLVSSFGLLVSFQLVIGILQHFSIVLVSYKSLVFLLV